MHSVYMDTHSATPRVQLVTEAVVAAYIREISSGDPGGPAVAEDGRLHPASRQRSEHGEAGNRPASRSNDSGVSAELIPITTRPGREHTCREAGGLRSVHKAYRSHRLGDRERLRRSGALGR